MSTDLFKSNLAIPTASDSPAMESLCPSDLPLVLLPVRLETRFFPLAGGSMELRVRIYPDKIHLDSHERALTPDEHTWGRHYWEQDWHAGDDEQGRMHAWRQIADRFSAARAAWIVRVLQPGNPRPTSPTPAGQPLAVAPVFPAVDIADTEAAWRHAPQARLLPDRWIAIVHSAGRVALTATGNDIQRPLPAGPNPRSAAPQGEVKAAIERGERLAIDDDMKWMVDFETAEAAGMALRLSIPPATMTAGIDSLVVFGVLRSASVAETAHQLADLFDAHHYTDGMAFLRPGAPTNNTDNRRTGYGSEDPGHARSFATEIAPPQAAGISNASRVATVFGIPFPRIDATFGRIDRARVNDDADMRSMNTALWQVSWGYFLSNLIGSEAGLTPAMIDWARARFLEHVRSFGPFPAFRCGPQPYGILPVTSLDLWQGGGADESFTPQDAWLKDMLLKLRDRVWRPASASVARIGARQNPPDPDADLNDVMRVDALANSYGARNVFGKHFLQHMYRLLASSWPDSDPAQLALLEQLGLGWRPRLTRLWHAQWRQRVSAPLIQPGEVSPWAKLEPNYIAELLQPLQIDQLIENRPAAESTDKTTALLKVLLRHAFLREIAHAAALLQVNDAGGDLNSLLRDAELVDLVTGALPTQHWRRQLGKQVAVTGQRTIKQYLEDLSTFTQPGVVALGEFRSSLARLKDLDSESLLHLMQGTLDLSAHRLDAWITSFATKRLAAMHIDGPKGQYVGAYGWVENLKPIPSARARPVTVLPPGESAPLQTPANDSGFIHAPSMTHGATAALLRNAHLGATGVPTADGPYAIELTSRRVREATRLLDGVRQGQPLGALLGYRVERMLHDMRIDNGKSMDRFIAAVRRVAPLVARASTDSTGPTEAIAANNVVDGLVLHRRWQEENATVRQELNKEGVGTGEFNALNSVFAALGDMTDGLGDALMAEAAYQMARGNTSRLASTLGAIAVGDAPPPELEVTRTPRSGTSLAHRVLLLMSGTTNLNTPGWLGGDAGIRSRAERLLNFWVAKLLGDARKIRCTLERLDATNIVVQTQTLYLSELGITPLDVVYGVEPDSDVAQAGQASSVIEQQVIYHIKRKSGGFDPQANVRLQHARPADLVVGELTLYDVLEQARAIRLLLSVARGAEPEDLNPPERTGQGIIDLTELESRVAVAENALNAAHKGLLNLLGKPTTTAESLRVALLKLGVFGVGPAIPLSVAGEDAGAIAILTQQSQALLKLSDARLNQFLVLRALPAATEQRARRDQLVARMRAVFGPSFVVLPRFNFDAAAAAEIGDALARSTQTQGGDPLAANTWFARCSRVRDPVARMGACLQRAEVLGAGARLNLSVMQLPHVAGERWVGLPPTAETVLPPSKLSLVVHTVGTVTPSQVMTGLLVDEWVEIVPNSKETTALAFQFDAPDANAPQSVLIAVPPVPGQDWTVETLRRVLMETLDLAKLRAVDTGSLGAPAQHLPGLYLAFNTSDHAVSTDFKPLTA